MLVVFPLVVYFLWAQFVINFSSFPFVFLCEVGIFGRESKILPRATLCLIQRQEFMTLNTRFTAIPSTVTIIVVTYKLGIITIRKWFDGIALMCRVSYLLRHLLLKHLLTVFG